MTKDELITLLATNDFVLGRAIVVLNERQTSSEQVQQVTRDANGRGFRPCDAYMGSALATWFLKHGKLSPKQLAYFRKPNAKGNMRIACYTRQLLEIAEEKKVKAAEAAAKIQNELGSPLRPGEFEALDNEAKNEVSKLGQQEYNANEFDQAQYEHDRDEAIMQRLEKAADLAMTIRDEENKHYARQLMENK